MVSYLASHFCTPFAKYAAAFFRQLAPPLLALRTARRAAPRVPGRLAAKTLLTPGRRNDPCGTCPPSSPLLWAGRPLTSSHRRDRPAPSPAISRTTPSPSEHHALDTVPSYPATRTPGPHCPRNTRHLRAGRRQPQDTARAPPASRRRPSTTVPETLTAVLGITFTYAP